MHSKTLVVPNKMKGNYFAVGAVVVLYLAVSCYAEEHINNPDETSSAICSGVPPGAIFLFPYPGDCTRYYECIDGNATVLQCQDGLWFNEALQACDHPETSGCSDLVCPPGVVDYYPFPGDCTKYIECYNGGKETQQCPPNLWFNPVEKRCTSQEQSGCGQYSSVPPTFSTPGGVCYGVLPGYIHLFPYPGDCSKYIECLGNTETVLQCPPGLYFNDDRQMCDHPALSGCDAATGTTPAVPPSTIGGGTNDPRCADGNNNFWPDVDCTKFVECYNGQGYILDCPSGLYFNAVTQRCENPGPGVCGATTRTPDPNSTTPSGVWPDPDCPWPATDVYLYPYPGDCTKFIECVWGVKTVQDCPPDLWFNPNLKVCDYPYQSGCIQQPSRE